MSVGTGTLSILNGGSVTETGTLTTAITDVQGFGKSIEFGTNSARLMPSSREQLRHVADVLTRNPTLNIKIAGYTDDVGDETRNMKLSTDRATNTMKGLVKFGVDAARMAAGRRHLHGHIGHRAGKTRTGTRHRVRPRDMVVGSAAHLAHDPAPSLLAR